MYLYLSLYICIYIYIHTHAYVYTHIYQRGRDRRPPGHDGGLGVDAIIIVVIAHVIVSSIFISNSNTI